MPDEDGAREDRYLSLRDLSAYAGLSVSTLRTYLQHPTHALPAYRIGGKILVRRSDYDAWAAQFRRDEPDTVGEIVTDMLAGLRS